MADDGKRLFITPESSTKENESRTSIPTNKPDSCRGKKRAATGKAQEQDDNGSSMDGTGKGKEVRTCGTDNSDHEAHIQTERDRRKRMRDLFSSLQTFHSHLPPKIDKATIVEETVNYIKNLERTLESLQKRKLDQIRSAFLSNQKPSSASSSLVISPEHPVSREAFLADQIGKFPSLLDTATQLPPPGQPCYSIQTWTSPNVVLSIVGIDAYISVCTPKRPGLITATALFLERHGAEALAVQTYSDPFRTTFIMFARANDAAGSFDVNPMPADERFKLALGELIIWLGSSN